MKAIDDEDLEKDLTFGIKLSGVGLPQATIEFDPDTVMVTITDNDGVLSICLIERPHAVSPLCMHDISCMHHEV